MTPNQFADMLPALTRLAIALERIADHLALPAPAYNVAPPPGGPSPETPAGAKPGTSSPVLPALSGASLGTEPLAKDFGPPIPFDTVRAAVNAYADSHGAAAAQGIIKGFGATFIKDLKADPSKYADVLAALK